MSSSPREQRLALTKSTLLSDEVDKSPRQFHAPRLLQAGMVVTSIWLFVLALQLIKAGAAGLSPMLDAVSVGGVPGYLGFGWIGSYVVMSGSPVAAVAMSLYAGGATTDAETLAMLNGSRLGASLIVLVVGFVAYATGKRNPDGLYIGVVALVTAVTLWAPVLPLGLFVLYRDWLDGVAVESPAFLTSFVGAISDPVVEPLDDVLPAVLLFVAGVSALVGGFALFDRSLPSLERPGPRFEALSQTLQKPLAMFGFGTLVTLLTLSVSLSVTILVPLALKGYIRRDRVVPYILGANIATWVDTLLAALLLDSPGAFEIVAVQMITGGLVSLLVLTLLYRPYTSFVLGVAHRVSSSRRHLVVFMAAMVFMPVLLLML